MQHIFNSQLNNWGHIEYRESADDSWHHVSDIDIDRAQQGTTLLFGSFREDIADALLGAQQGTTLLFGIGETRSGFPPVAPNRGIPDDVSDPTRTDYESASTEGQKDDRFGQTVLTGEDVAHTDWEEASPSEQVVCRPQGVTTSEWRGSIYVPREGGWAKANLFASLLDISDAQEAALARGETIGLY